MNGTPLNMLIFHVKLRRVFFFDYCVGIEKIRSELCIIICFINKTDLVRLYRNYCEMIKFISLMKRIRKILEFFFSTRRNENRCISRVILSSFFLLVSLMF